MSNLVKDETKEIDANKIKVDSDPKEVTSEINNSIKTIVITIESYKNLTPLYPVSDIKAQLKYLESDVGETSLTPVVVDEYLKVNETFQLQVDTSSIKDVDMLASNPIFLTTFQSSGTLDASLYEQLKEVDATKPETDVISLFSMYEAFTGEKVQIDDIKEKTKGKSSKTAKKSADKDKKSKSKQTSKGSKGSKKDITRGSKLSKGSKSSATSDDTSKSGEVAIKSELYGMCTIDLIPLFYGETKFTEKILLRPVKQSCLLLNTHKRYPEVTVTIEVKENDKLLEIPNILHFTIESIFNPPTLMVEDMETKICAMFPLGNFSASPMIFYNPKVVQKSPENEIPKRWPCIHDIGHNANTTKYFIDTEIEKIKNKTQLDIKQAYKSDSPRIEYNYLKRNILLNEGLKILAAHIKNHRKIVLELFVTPRTKTKADAATEEIGVESFKVKPGKVPTHLHLMAVLDVVSLLYPGVTRVRTAVPLQTFTYEEAEKSGLTDSFFFPKPKAEASVVKPSKLKLDTVKKKKGSDKKDKSTASKEEKNLAGQLPVKPEAPPTPEPSVPVYDENAQQCFIIVEIELLKSIYPKRDLEEVELDLYQLQMEAMNTPKTILSKKVATDLYRQTIHDIVTDLNKHYSDYNEKKMAIPQKDYGAFINYLHQVGAYNSYLSSMTNTATLLVNNKYKCQDEDLKNSTLYQSLVSEIYTELISEMHAILNSLVCSGLTPPFVRKNPPDYIYFFARETTEINQLTISERIYLERLINDGQGNPDFWFDFAIFNMEQNQTEKAMECIKEAVCIDAHHRNSLVMFGVLLYEKQKIQQSETCFLSLMITESKWARGWCILYLYYEKCGRLDGMDMALDMATNYADQPESKNYFDDFDDLAWSVKNIPNTIFFNTAILLLKMRLYSWVELALSHEITVPKYYGYVNYMLAAVQYYKRNYDHAFEHINEAKEFQGGDFAILGLSGHILFAQNNLTEAKEEYFHVIESFDRPDDIHLTYLNCSNILERLGDDQTARKLILIACKYHPTPHVWLTAGKLYFKQNDVLSAEECLTQANMADNKNAEVWAYLALINLKLKRLDEAQQCYQQAIKNKFADVSLDSAIKDEFKKIYF
ncbi:cilia- and flagella-associated protein 70-like [Rhynchophorus ferrugineus]|uniref:cilia- and flagella-associated protein 70-like n=1 Tax=Rhynchophorus ferrugineus TaxID=354439 RepID=UPI003FCE00E6